MQLNLFNRKGRSLARECLAGDLTFTCTSLQIPLVDDNHKGD
jgi:hypothetical protein